jgi:hypothetical protein
MPVFIPPIEYQQEIVNLISPIRQDSLDLIIKAKKLLDIAEKSRYSYLYKAFGSPKDLRLRRNPEYRFKDLIKLSHADPEADFWILRSGGDTSIGKPFDEHDPKFIPMESQWEFEQSPRMPSGRKKTYMARAPRKGYDPRNHIGVTVLRQDILLPEFLFYIAEYTWRAGVFQAYCHGTTKLVHLRQRDVECGLSVILNHLRSKRRNPDVDLRTLERKFTAHPSKELALKLYAARKRAGDDRAGIKFYDYIYEEALEKDDNFADPFGFIYVIDDKFYCNDCGFEAGMEALKDEIPDRFFPLSQDHPDIADFEMDAAQEFVDYALGHLNIYAAFKKIERDGPANLRELINKNEQIVCAECGYIIKLDTDGVPWQEALRE